MKPKICSLVSGTSLSVGAVLCSAAGMPAEGRATRVPLALSAGAAPVRLGEVDSIIEQAIADKNIPGAVLIVGHDGKVVYRKAYGNRALEPRREAMTLDTVL